MDPAINYLVSWWRRPAILEGGGWSLWLDVEGGDGGQDPDGLAKSQRLRGKHGGSSLLCSAPVLRSCRAARQVKSGPVNGCLFLSPVLRLCHEKWVLGEVV